MCREGQHSSWCPQPLSASIQVAPRLHVKAGVRSPLPPPRSPCGSWAGGDCCPSSSSAQPWMLRGGVRHGLSHSDRCADLPWKLASTGLIGPWEDAREELDGVLHRSGGLPPVRTRSSTSSLLSVKFFGRRPGELRRLLEKELRATNRSPISSSRSSSMGDSEMAV